MLIYVYPFDCKYARKGLVLTTALRRYVLPTTLGVHISWFVCGVQDALRVCSVANALLQNQRYAFDLLELAVGYISSVSVADKDKDQI